MVVGVNIIFLHMVSLCEQRGTQIYNLPKRRNLSSATNASTNAQAMVCGELGWSNLITHIVDIYSSPWTVTRPPKEVTFQPFFPGVILIFVVSKQRPTTSFHICQGWRSEYWGQRGSGVVFPTYPTHTAFAHRRFVVGISKNPKTDEWTDCKK